MQQVYRGNNKDNKVDAGGPIDSGWHGINIHRASSSWQSKQVNKWSAGCQVLAKGEVALYDDLGSKIHLQRGGNILLQTSTKITFDVPDVCLTGNLTADGEILDLSGSNSASMSSMRKTYNKHDHTSGVGLPSSEM